jgi:hypothetical protein
MLDTKNLYVNDSGLSSMEEAQAEKAVNLW